MANAKGKLLAMLVNKDVGGIGICMGMGVTIVEGSIFKKSNCSINNPALLTLSEVDIIDSGPEIKQPSLLAAKKAFFAPAITTDSGVTMNPAALSLSAFHTFCLLFGIAIYSPYKHSRVTCPGGRRILVLISSLLHSSHF